MPTDEADEDEEERLLVLTASGERLRLDGGDRLAEEDEDVDSLRVGLPITPNMDEDEDDECEMRVESPTRLLKGLSQLISLADADDADAHMSKLLEPERDGIELCSGKWLNVKTFVLVKVLRGDVDEEELFDEEDM